MYRIEKKNNSVLNFFSNLINFPTGTPTTNKLDDGIPVTHFYDFNTCIFCKMAPSHSFDENDYEATSVSN